MGCPMVHKLYSVGRVLPQPSPGLRTVQVIKFLVPSKVESAC